MASSRQEDDLSRRCRVPARHAARSTRYPRRWDRLTKGRRGHICKRGPKIPADPIGSAHQGAGRFMSHRFSTYALALAVLLVSAAPGAAASLSIAVPAGQWLTLPAAGIVRVDTQPADVAIASTDADTVKIFGA